jgi:ribonuclease P/MRP protein subunit POP8
MATEEPIPSANTETIAQDAVTSSQNSGEQSQSRQKEREAIQGDPGSKKKPKTKPHHVLHQATLRKPSWTYFRLQLFSSPLANEHLDILTAKSYLNSALQRFLGLHGAAIPVDILKLEGTDIWIRVPREDVITVHEAIASWMGDGVRWAVKGRDEWLVRLADGGDGQDLFKP